MYPALAVNPLGHEDAVRALVLPDHGQKLLEALEADIAQGLRMQENIRSGLLSRVDDIQLAIRWGFAAILFINALLILAGAMTVMRDMGRKRAELALLDQRAAVLA